MKKQPSSSTPTSTTEHHYNRRKKQKYTQDNEEDHMNSSSEGQPEIQPLLVAFEHLVPFHQNIFLSRLVRTLSLEQIHLLFRKLNGLMTVNFIGTLPVDVAYRILSFLDNSSLYIAMLVCRQWHQIIHQSDLIWSFLFQHNKTHQCQCLNYLQPTDLLPHRAILKRHLQIKKNWKNSNYKLINVVCRDVGVITVIQFDQELIMMGTDDGHVLAANTKNGLIIHSFAGHTGGVWALQFIGDLLVTGSTDRTIRIWNIKEKRLVQTLIGHRSTVRCLGVTQNSQFIISGSRDKTVKIWRIRDGTLLHSFDNHHSDSVRCLALQGMIAVTGSYDCTLRVWNIERGECIHSLIGHNDKIYSVAFRDNLIVSGGHTGSVKVWDSQSGNCLFSLEGHCNLVSTVIISPNYIATGSTDCSVRHWDKHTGNLIAKYSLHTVSVSALAADEYRMLTGSDSSLKFWNIENGQCKELLPEVNVIWRVDMDETTCVATGDSTVDINGTRVDSSTLHIFHYYSD